MRENEKKWRASRLSYKVWLCVCLGQASYNYMMGNATA